MRAFFYYALYRDGYLAERRADVLLPTPFD